MDIDLGDVNDRVKNELISAELAIFVLSPNFHESPYCLAEMGAAWGTDRKKFILTVPPLDKKGVKAVFEGLQIEQLQAEKSLNKLVDVIDRYKIERSNPSLARWNEKRDEFLRWLGEDYKPAETRQRRVEDSPKWRDRGHWSQSIVDGTLYIGSGYVNKNAKQEIMRTIRKGLILPTVFAYLTNAGYHNWIRLTEDVTYQYYYDSIKLLQTHAKSIATEIKSAVGRDDVDLISLGPGDGRKDSLLLKELSELFAVSDLYYYPFDINPSMISTAMGTAGAERKLKKLQVKAILADFESLPEFSNIYQYRDAPNVLTLVGNTLGNLPDDRGFLTQLHERAMSDGDLLLLEVRKTQDGDPILKTETNREFDFGPLEILGLEFDPDKLHYNSVDEYSLVPGTETILTTYDSIRYEEKEFKDVKLSLIREYDAEALEIVCKKIGFKVLERYDQGSAAALLLRK